MPNNRNEVTKWGKGDKRLSLLEITRNLLPTGWNHFVIKVSQGEVEL